MRPARLLSEVWRNLLSRPLLSLIAVLAALVIGLVSSLWAISTAARVQERWELQLLRGAFSVRAVEALGGQLSAARCDDLNGVVGVQASGGRLHEELVALYGRHDGRVYLQHVTAGYIAFVFPAEQGVSGAGVVAGREVAARLEIQGGEFLPLVRPPGATPGWLAVDHTVDTDARVAGAGGAVMIATAAAGGVSECDVAIEPRYFESVVTLLQGWFDGDGVVVGPFLPGDDTRASPESDLIDRPTRFVGIGAGVLLALVAAAIGLLRRGELALYVILGLDYRRLLLMASAETLLLLAAPFCAGVAVTLLAREELIGPATLATFPSDIALVAPILVLMPWISLLIVRAARPLLLLRET